MDLPSLYKKSYLVMGVLNVTPDSFYDGGLHNSLPDAVSHGEKLIADGADLLDIGGESTRPGAQHVPENEEIQRVVPVIEQLASKFDIPISIDTTKSGVAAAAFNAGATWLNDISAGRFDPEIKHFAAQKRCPVILMHSRGTPQTMQHHPEYKDVTGEVIDELNKCIDDFKSAGVKQENIILDPGIGFAKRFQDNLTLLNRLDEIVALKYPVAIGTSRKSFIGRITGKEPYKRLPGTLATIAGAYSRGATIFRVHDVSETVDFLKVFSLIESGH
ncbi:MAG: dihydropteroate synthase [Chitinivibrionales bacterium]|nr:dihydropteroate synthase [Chitinivibrionales bacterium]